MEAVENRDGALRISGRYKYQDVAFAPEMPWTSMSLIHPTPLDADLKQLAITRTAR